MRHTSSSKPFRTLSDRMKNSTSVPTTQLDFHITLSVSVLPDSCDALGPLQHTSHTSIQSPTLHLLALLGLLVRNPMVSTTAWVEHTRLRQALN